MNSGNNPQVSSMPPATPFPHPSHSHSHSSFPAEGAASSSYPHPYGHGNVGGGLGTGPNFQDTAHTTHYDGTPTPTPTAPLNRSSSRISRRSGASSTPSRAQSLIKKSIELQDLKPADVLIERFVAWKAIVKQLTAYFEGIADIETNTARELAKLAGVIQVPFRAGNQFLGEGGVQDVFFAIRDRTRSIADQHANLGRTVEHSIVQHLRKLGEEVRAHVKNVQNDTGKLAASVAKERETSTRLVGELANAVSMYKNTPMGLSARGDPFLANQLVSLQLSRQIIEENLLQKSIVIMQSSSATFEAGIVRSIKSAWETFDEWYARMSGASRALYEAVGREMRGVVPEREWVEYAARSEHLLDPETPLRDPEYVNYPLKDDPSTRPIHSGHLERKSGGWTGRGWKEGWYVLTPAGFLHEFVSSDPGVGNKGLQPTFSIFLPNCTLGPPTGDRNASGGWRFHIEGRRDGTGSAGGGGGGSDRAWTFRSRSKSEMMEWWNDIRMLCARYLVASESVRRTGPVERAVQSVGYASEDEDEIYYVDEAEEGSSVEEEIDEHMVEVRENPRVVELGGYNVGGAGYEEVPPNYTGHSRYASGGAEVGPNGYVLEKKPRYTPPQPAYYEGDDHAPAPVGSGTIHPNVHNGGGNGGGGGGPPPPPSVTGTTGTTQSAGVDTGVHSTGGKAGGDRTGGEKVEENAAGITTTTTTSEQAGVHDID
ncbi:hypothetical protein FA13DRAFT_1663464 [Coprinellus micaceus]|uniref:PH domain-containing protein n=1 Tax=Coprinellus micaceus TaxID=71717 RepID=A0A4Y7TC35_COPMI|nr:hypothetical protein FA13DRAFT_1663464 [Coprinellus micaceus]